MSKPRILIVDDEVSFTKLLKLNLEGSGRYEVRTENWAPKAAATAREFHPDLIFLDVMMPGMDGGEVAAKIREVPSLQKTPIIFLTAAVKKEEVAKTDGRIGGDIYIAKPVEYEEIERCIEAELARQAAE